VRSFVISFYCAASRSSGGRPEVDRPLLVALCKKNIK